MFRFILTGKILIGSIIFLIFICIGCVIWYQYNTKTYQQELTESFELQDQTGNTTQQTVDESAEGNATSSEGSLTVKTDDISDKFSSDATLQEEDDSDETITVAGRVIRLSDIPDVPKVSPHGFGPFPEVPKDYNGMVVWRNIDYYDLSHSDQRAFELLHRVLIKLWSEGKRNFKGGKIDGNNGKVYPNFSDTVYITVKDLEYPNGVVVPRITRQLGIAPFGVDLLNPPPHIKVLDYESSGIDPFQYLDLP